MLLHILCNIWLFFFVCTEVKNDNLPKILRDEMMDNILLLLHKFKYSSKHNYAPRLLNNKLGNLWNMSSSLYLKFRNISTFTYIFQIVYLKKWPDVVCLSINIIFQVY